MSAKPPARLCSRRQSQGQPCRSVAVTGSPFCHAHARAEQRLRRQRHTARISCRRDSPTHLGSLTTRASILRALSRVLHAIAAGTLDYKLAASLLSRLQRATRALDQRTLIARDAKNDSPQPTNTLNLQAAADHLSAFPPFSREASRTARSAAALQSTKPPPQPTTHNLQPTTEFECK